MSVLREERLLSPSHIIASSQDELREWKSNLELAKHEQKLLKALSDNERLLKLTQNLLLNWSDFAE